MGGFFLFVFLIILFSELQCSWSDRDGSLLQSLSQISSYFLSTPGILRYPT